MKVELKYVLGDSARIMRGLDGNWDNGWGVVRNWNELGGGWKLG